MFCAIFSSAPHFLLGSCIKLLSIFCGKFLWHLLPRIDVASYHRACFAQFFPCSSLPNRKLHQATERNLRKFSLPPLFSNWRRIMLLSTFCVVELWPLIFQLKIASCYWACFAQFFPAPHFLLISCIKLLSIFCGKFLRHLLPRIDVASYHRACFAQFFPCSSLPNRKLHQATERNLRKFSSPPLFPNWRRIMLLSTFCVVELWPLIFQLKIASC